MICWAAQPLRRPGSRADPAAGPGTAQGAVTWQCAGGRRWTGARAGASAPQSGACPMADLGQAAAGHPAEHRTGCPQRSHLRRHNRRWQGAGPLPGLRHRRTPAPVQGSARYPRPAPPARACPGPAPRSPSTARAFTGLAHVCVGRTRTFAGVAGKIGMVVHACGRPDCRFLNPDLTLTGLALLQPRDPMVPASYPQRAASGSTSACQGGERRPPCLAIAEADPRWNR